MLRGRAAAPDGAAGSAGGLLPVLGKKKNHTGRVFQEAEAQNRFSYSCRCSSGTSFTCNLTDGAGHFHVPVVANLCGCFANVLHCLSATLHISRRRTR